MFGGGDVPALAKKVDLVVGVDPPFQMESQMEVQKTGRRTGTRGRALFRQGCFPRCVRAEAGGAADGDILSFALPVEHGLCRGIIADFFISQDCHQTLLHGSKAAFDFAFGLRTRCDQMSDTEGGESTLELGAGIAVVGHGIMAKEAEAVGVYHHRQVVLEKKTAKMLEVIPGRVRGDKDRAQKFARMVIDGEQEGLLLIGRPPLVDGGVMLPQFADA